ncbi:MAG: phage protein Gp36 family protein [Bacteroidales bacterium]
MFLEAEELKSHLYSESVTAITQGDDTILQMAIDAALSEAKGYLQAFDQEAIFTAEGDNRNALLLTWCKDIAVWHFINIARPAIDYDIRERRYNAAIDWLKGVQKGQITPDLPKPPTEEQVPEIIISSNPRRTNHI